MKKRILFICMLFLVCIKAMAINIDVTATAGVAAGGYNNLIEVFDAINAGTHQGDIVISINYSIADYGSAVLNSSGAGLASYTSVNIHPMQDGIVIFGYVPSGRGVIELNGADNVTIDGDNPLTDGIDRNLSIRNSGESTILFSSVVRVATSAAITTANNITIKNCEILGSASEGNSPSKTSYTENYGNSSGILCSGGAGASATAPPVAITDYNLQHALSGQKFNGLVISNNVVNACANGIFVNAVENSLACDSITVINNIVGSDEYLSSGSAPYNYPLTTVYMNGIAVYGFKSMLMTGNSVQNIISYIGDGYSNAAGIVVTASGATGGNVFIANNYVSGIIKNTPGNGSVRGMNLSIDHTGGNYIAKNNTVTNVQSFFDGSNSPNRPTGIGLGGKVTLDGNKISKIRNNNTTHTGGVVGLQVYSGTTVVKNNFISDINENVSMSAVADGWSGITGIELFYYSGANHKIYNNTVVLTGNTIGAGGANVVIADISFFYMFVRGVDVRNNLFVNTMTLSGSTGYATGYAFNSVSTPINLTLNNNAIFTGATGAGRGVALTSDGGTPVLYTVGMFNAGAITPAGNLRAYTSTLNATGTNDDASLAFTGAPVFVNSTDLHLQAVAGNAALVSGAALGVDADIDGNPRSATMPVIGAHEAAIPVGCNGMPVAGIVNASVSSACDAFTSVLSAPGASSGPGIKYQWQTAADSSSYTNIPGATNASYTAAVTATAYYRLNVTCSTSAMSAVSTGVLVTVTHLSPITGSRNVCLGMTTSLTHGIAGGSWSSSNSGIASVDGAGVVTGNVAGTTIITYTAPGGCMAMATITANAMPAAITGFGDICSGNTATLANATTGGSWSSSDVSVASVDAATGIVTSGTAAGMVTITYTSAAGCSVTTPEINPVGNITGSNGVCTGLTTTLSSTTGGGTWTSSNTTLATIGTSGIVSGIAGGAVVITYASASCYRTLEMTISTTPAPVTGAGAVCAGNILTLSDANTGGTWTSVNAGELTLATLPSGAATVLGVTAGVVNVTYSLSAACKITVPVSVNALPATISGTLKACPGTTTTLSDVTSGGTWVSGNSSVATIDAATGIATGITAGTALISYVLPATCVRTAVLTINPLPAAISGTLSACVGSTTNLSDVTPAGLSWISSNTSVATVNATGGVVSGVSAGNALITYTVSSGCRITAEVTIYAVPAAINGTLKVCSGLTISLTSASAGGVWTSNNTAIAAVDGAGVVTGNAAGTTTITYTLGASCSKTAVVTVTPVPAAITGALSICQGNTGTLINAGGGSWSSDNTAIVSVLSVTGAATGVAAGTANVTYSLGSGCQSAAVVTVNPLPAPVSGALTVCPGSTATLANATVGGTWASGNTSYATVGSASGILTGMATGTARITYTAATGCIATGIATVSGLPTAITGTTTLTTGTTVTLANATAGGSWASSATGTATIGSVSGVVSGITAGTATISYTLPSGCRGTTTVTVNAAATVITGTPKACLGGSTTLSGSTLGGAWSSSNTAVATVDAGGVVTSVSAGTSVISYVTAPGVYTTTIVTVNTQPAAITGTMGICIGAMNTLYNATTGGNSWVSSDPSVVNIGVLSGIITGVTAGTSAITYTLNSGCSSTAIVTVNPLPAAIAGQLKPCTGATTTLTDVNPSGVWTSGNTGVATVSSSLGIVTGNVAGTSRITYTLPTGCIATAVVTVNLSPSAITGNPVACTGTTATLASTGGGTWASGNMAVGSVSGSGVVTGATPGTTVITFTATNGCTAATVVTVNAVPLASTGTAGICTGSTTTLANATPGGTWTSSNTAIATVGAATGIVSSLSSTGTVNIIYSLSAPGCQATRQVTVSALPTAITGTLSVCAGSATTLSSSVGGAWSSVNLSVGSVGSISTVSGRVAGIAAGNTVISYTTPAGCSRSVVVTVNASPDAGTISSSNGFALHTVSAPTSTVFATTGDAGGTWTSSAATKASVVAATGMVSAVAAGTANITYSVTVGGCTASTAHVISVTAGRPAGNGTNAVQAATEISIYPNPSKGVLNISSTAAGTFSVYSLDGKEIGTYDVAVGVTTVTLPSGIVAGVYLCRYTAGNGNTATVRIVVEQ